MTEPLINLKVVTPQKELLNKMVDEVIVNGAYGQFGVLLGCIPIIAPTSTGELKYRIGKTWHTENLEEGFANIDNNVVNVFAIEPNSTEVVEAIDS